MWYNCFMINADEKVEILPKTLYGDDSIDHIYCECDRNVSLCGFDISDHFDNGMETEEDNPDFCVVCLEIEEANQPCRNCGNTI